MSAMMGEAKWQFWVDRGGTFTDVVAMNGAGQLHRAKLLSEDPGRYADAAIEAMRRITGTADGALPPAELRIGTTVATNALLERKGEPVLLAITRGFADALRIGTQERPELFARKIILPEPLYCDVAEITERVTAEGAVLTPLDEDAARTQLQAARQRGLRALAIALVHGYRHTAHEEALIRIAHEEGFTQISASHRTAPLIRLVPRGDTAVADAYLSPVLHRYVEGLQAGLGPNVEALFMQSGGGLARAASFQGKDAILSGPAGGIVGMAAIAREAGIDEVIGFDMGGTSTDVSHYAGRYERSTETRISGVRIRAPMMRVHTVAAGGGSICGFDGVRLHAGPQSAGAVPGPACYRGGGPLTVTDCNLVLGKLQPHHFPSVFGPNGDQSLDLSAAELAIDALVEDVETATGKRYGREEAAEGLLHIAVANMANAIKAISVQRGHDTGRATLVSFGGAGGQHACLVADALGIRQVLCHPLASLLSAYGIGLAEQSTSREQTLRLPLVAEHLDTIGQAIAQRGRDAESELAADCRADAAIRREATLFIRPDGSENAIEVPWGALEPMRSAFTASWRTRFGFATTGPLIAESIRVEAVAANCHSRRPAFPLPPKSEPPLEHVKLHSGGQLRRAPLYRREGLSAGFETAGPALVVDDVSTIVVEPGWQARMDGLGNLLLVRSEPMAATTSQTETAVDPVRLEIMSALFMAVAEEMGAALQSSARSVNIRERLDFSCALFDRDGNLIANAPHMPVHLGSMGESVRTIIARRGGQADGRGLLRGDAYALNAPYEGGTHLPDITVVMPVFAEQDDDDRPAWFVAARGHHADIGGIAPGSMPPDSRSVEEEGVLLDNVLLVDRGRLCETDVLAMLGSGRWPARNPQRNIDDLKAQLASCARGAAELQRMAREQGRGTIDAYMIHVQAQAEEAVRHLIGRLSDGHARCMMDNGAQIAVRVTVDREGRTAMIDFTGSSPQLPGNFNAPLPIVRAAVLYVVRTLLDEGVPMNEGCLRPLDIVVPEGSMLHPRSPAAVVAGNVETSQVVTDALFAALGAMAGSQGTMNNFTFGNARHQYYETIAGGAGAGPGFDGADAVQTHMTNSRLTDVEVLESTYPVTLEEFSIRRGSGGAGQWHGGNGVVRRIRFRETMTAGILSNRRLVPPAGLAGGEPGATGSNRIERADGAVLKLESCAQVEMAPDDTFIILTPGGGGYGRKAESGE